jgi:hypothetical protein
MDLNYLTWIVYLVIVE